MRALVRFSAAVALVSLTASACSGSSEKEDSAGRGSNTVCGAFAQSDNVRSAVREATGVDGCKDDRSQPDEALRSLREADGKLDQNELMGSPYCRIQSAENGKEVLSITLPRSPHANKPDS
ncbi:hypothetical protein SHKM778_47860 [Streptomyces sp. KM77-8]|uniref:Secreted protein n=1 Tax=Streptomyces haneummycinicus TaxID=3074435 RepID=A0AAT9HMP2_9ACTN